MEKRGINPLLLNPSIGCSGQFHLTASSPTRQNTQYRPDREPWMPTIWSGRLGEEKNILPLPWSIHSIWNVLVRDGPATRGTEIQGALKLHWNNQKYGVATIRFSTCEKNSPKLICNFGTHPPKYYSPKKVEEYRFKGHQVIGLPRAPTCLGLALVLVTIPATLSQLGTELQTTWRILMGKKIQQ
jgi:hypothetical protein